jgi:hypothetical protein
MQTRCKECGRRHKLEYDREVSRQKNIAAGGKVLGSPFICIVCRKVGVREKLSQEYCWGECREATLKDRYRKRKGSKLLVGDTINCVGVGCGIEIIRRSPSQKFCKKCAEEALDKSHVDRWLIRNGRETRSVGYAASCKRCEKEFIRASANSQYCCECAPEAARDVLRMAQARRLSNPQHRLNARIATRISGSLKGVKDRRKWQSLVDYSLAVLIRHLERGCLEGMTWENYGRWHVDHIIPLASFVFDSAEHPEFRAAWALPNLQPLWKRDNLSKGGKRIYLI